MPLYDFTCKQCKTTFEAIVKLDDLNKKNPVCPKCGDNTERQISPLKATSTTWKHWRIS